MGDSLLTTATAQMERVKRTAGPNAVDAKQAARDAKARGIARMQDMERQVASLKAVVEGEAAELKAERKAHAKLEVDLARTAIEKEAALKEAHKLELLSGARHGQIEELSALLASHKRDAQQKADEQQQRLAEADAKVVLLTKKDHLASSLHVARQQEVSAQQAREKANVLRYQQLQMRCLEAEASASKSEKRVASLSSANHLFSAKLEKPEREAENAEQKMRHAEFVKEQADARANSIQGAANEHLSKARLAHSLASAGHSSAKGELQRVQGENAAQGKKLAKQDAELTGLRAEKSSLASELLRLRQTSAAIDKKKESTTSELGQLKQKFRTLAERLTRVRAPAVHTDFLK